MLPDEFNSGNQHNFSENSYSAQRNACGIGLALTENYLGPQQSVGRRKVSKLYRENLHRLYCGFTKPMISTEKPVSLSRALCGDFLFVPHLSNLF